MNLLDLLKGKNIKFKVIKKSIVGEIIKINKLLEFDYQYFLKIKEFETNKIFKIYTENALKKMQYIYFKNYYVKGASIAIFYFEEEKENNKIFSNDYFITCLHF
jgi:hypothetical protein